MRARACAGPLRSAARSARASPFPSRGVRRAAQHEGLRPVGAGAQLHLHPVADPLPVRRLGNLPGPFPQLALRRADQVAPPGLLQPRDVLGAHHAAVHDPDALGQAVARLHRLDDLFDRRDVGAVPGEDLVAQRHPLAGHHQRDADLLAVGPVVAAVAARRQRVPLGQPLEVRARHVVEQQVVLQGEELAEPLLRCCSIAALCGKSRSSAR